MNRHNLPAHFDNLANIAMDVGAILCKAIEHAHEHQYYVTGCVAAAAVLTALESELQADWNAGDYVPVQVRISEWVYEKPSRTEKDWRALIAPLVREYAPTVHTRG